MHELLVINTYIEKVLKAPDILNVFKIVMLYVYKMFKSTTFYFSLYTQSYAVFLSYLSFKDILLLFSHRNGAVRKVAAQSLLAIVEKMGASRIFTQSKEVTEKLLPTTAQFLMDGTPLTRQVIFHFKMKKNIVF